LGKWNQKKGNETSFLVISGHHGVGKSAIVHQHVKQLVENQGGQLIIGKSDQFKSDLSFSVLIEAFSSMLRRTLSSEENTIKRHEELKAALGPKVKILAEIIEEVGSIVGNAGGGFCAAAQNINTQSPRSSSSSLSNSTSTSPNSLSSTSTNSSTTSTSTLCQIP